MKKIKIAIDGPAGAGKSTVAKLVACKLKYIYIDTGAMYRAITWAVLTHGISEDDKNSIIEIARHSTIRLENVDDSSKVFLNDKEVTEEIRRPEVSKMVPTIAKILEVREELLRMQRELAIHGGVVMDGRDIGTCILPDAELKIFLTASIEERAIRRYKELIAKEYRVDLKELKNEIAERDRMDYEREIAPLKQAEDAILIDTTKLAIDGAVESIYMLCKERTSVV